MMAAMFHELQEQTINWFNDAPFTLKTDKQILCFSLDVIFVALCRMVIFRPKNLGSIFLRNVGFYLQFQTALQPRIITQTRLKKCR
jgi:hypothetical protein